MTRAGILRDREAASADVADLLRRTLERQVKVIEVLKAERDAMQRVVAEARELIAAWPFQALARAIEALDNQAKGNPDAR